MAQNRAGLLRVDVDFDQDKAAEPVLTYGAAM
jgi:hypothetical protein